MARGGMYAFPGLIAGLRTTSRVSPSRGVVCGVLCVVVMPQLYLFARVQYSTACRVQ